jgi:hypothetical protein
MGLFRDPTTFIGFVAPKTPKLPAIWRLTRDPRRMGMTQEKRKAKKALDQPAIMSKLRVEVGHETG